TGAMILAPALILAVVEARRRWTRERAVEGALLLCGLGVSGFVVFHGLVPAPLIYLCVPFPFWAAFRFGRREAAAASVMLSALAVWGTVRGFGPFIRPTPNESLLLLQVFLGGLSVMVLAVAAVVAAAQGVERELRDARDELEVKVASRTESLSHA